MATPYRVVLVTAPRGNAAERLAKGLVAARLAACVNILPGLISHYRWKGRTHRDPEALLLVKTRAAKLKSLQRWIAAHHPYAVPEVIACPILSGSPQYLRWLGEQTR